MCTSKSKSCYAQGMLGIGAAMLGSSHVIGVDVDADALQTAQGNCEQYEDLQVSAMAVSLNCFP